MDREGYETGVQSIAQWLFGVVSYFIPFPLGLEAQYIRAAFRS